MPVKKSTAAPASSAATTSTAATVPPPTPAKPTKKEAPAAPVAAPVVATAPAPVPEEVVHEHVHEASNMDVLEKKVSELTAFCKDVQNILKVVKKEYEKLKKTSEKAEKKRSIARSTPSGFAKPTKISDELCEFLSVAKGSELSRTEVTRHITKYVRENNLNMEENKRIILPNVQLRTLLACKDTDVISYFNLQKWLKHHFVKI